MSDGRTRYTPGIADCDNGDPWSRLRAIDWSVSWPRLHPLLQPKDGITREATPEHFHANRICTVNSEMKGGCP